MLNLETVKLARESYKEFGDVIAARDDVKAAPANLNTALRYDRLAKLENLREVRAFLNVSVFKCKPWTPHKQGGNAPTLQLGVLERHPFSTQMFIPMGNVWRYLVVVAEGGDEPDLATLKAFVADGTHGITYKPGVWHHPLIALDNECDFVCLVYEDGTEGDCEIMKLDDPMLVKITS